MKGIREIFRKEITRVVKDKKMLFSVFLLPALLMVGLMMLIGNLQKNMMADIDNHIPVIYAERFPESFQKFLETGGYTYDLRAMESDRQTSGCSSRKILRKVLLPIKKEMRFLRLKYTTIRQKNIP